MSELVTRIVMGNQYHYSNSSIFRSGIRIRHILPGGFRFLDADPPEDAIQFQNKRGQILKNAFGIRFPELGRHVCKTVR